MRRFTLALALSSLCLAFTACGEPTEDTVIYAAEFHPDHRGMPKKGDPRFEASVVLLEDGGEGKYLAYPPPGPDDSPDSYSPGKDKAIAPGMTYLKDQNMHFSSGLENMLLAHQNPYKAYSPNKQGGKYVEAELGVNHYDKKAEKFFRVVPKHVPCWRCGATKQIDVVNDEGFTEYQECPECDEEGFVEITGLRQLKDHVSQENDGGSSKNRKSAKPKG